MSQAQKILDTLGGWANIREIDSCITRLRVEVNDPTIIDRDAVTATGAYDAILLGSTVQIVVGPDADDLLEEIEALRR